MYVDGLSPRKYQLTYILSQNVCVFYLFIWPFLFNILKLIGHKKSLKYVDTQDNKIFLITRGLFETKKLWYVLTERIFKTEILIILINGISIRTKFTLTFSEVWFGNLRCSVLG